MNTKGVLLAGGKATRLYPLTLSTNKHLLPIFSKPMIYYSLSTLMLSGIRDIIIVVDASEKTFFYSALGDGSKYGLNIEYSIQDKPDGLASAIYSAKDKIKNHNIKVILGDNIFYGKDLENILSNNSKKYDATFFTQNVNNPEGFGVLERNKDGKILKIIEKPKNYISSEAVLGLYFYNNEVIDLIEQLGKSERNELEIIDLLNKYRKKKKLKAEFLGRGGAWLDTGSIDDFYNTSSFVSALENRQGLKIACLEEIALNYNWINKKDIKEAINFYGSCMYSNYLSKLIK